MRAASGTKTTRLYGTISRNAPRPQRPQARRGRPTPVWTIWSCHTLARPSTTRPMPRVMISGWTRKTPTPMPVTSAGRARPRRAPRGCRRRVPGRRRASRRTNPAIDATAPTDRSMPPVSIVSVWQPARIASGTAARMIAPTQLGVTMPGRTSSLTTTRTPSRPISGMIGRSRNRRRKLDADSRGLRVPGASAVALMPGSAGSG